MRLRIQEDLRGAVALLVVVMLCAAMLIASPETAVAQPIESTWHGTVTASGQWRTDSVHPPEVNTTVEARWSYTLTVARDGSYTASGTVHQTEEEWWSLYDCWDYTTWSGGGDAISPFGNSIWRNQETDEWVLAPPTLHLSVTETRSAEGCGHPYTEETEFDLPHYLAGQWNVGSPEPWDGAIPALSFSEKAPAAGGYPVAVSNDYNSTGSIPHEPGSSSWSETATVSYSITWDPAADRDYDGVEDSLDNCPDDSNADQADIDADGIGDICEVVAVFKWKMQDLTLDANGDRIIDRYIGGNRAADVPADGRYPVVLDGCGSSGPVDSWTWNVGGTEIASSTCRKTVLVAEGNVPISLTVSSAAGASDTATGSMKVRNILIVSIGDSFASGEGVPRKHRTDGLPAVWDDKPCHRSAKAGPAKAALRAEKRSAQTSVTFIHLACSGATLTKGVLGPYPDPPGGGAGEKPQIAEARELVNGQVVDAVLISLGGNDIGFSDAITTCARFAKCPSEHRRGLLGGDVTTKSKTLHSEVQTKLGRVPGRYVKLNECLLVGGTCSIAGAADRPLRRAANGVFITEYPNLTRDGGGSYCDGALRPPLPSGVADEEFAWADEVVLRGVPGSTFKLDVNFGRDINYPVRKDGLNRSIAKTGARLGWNPVTGIHASSRTHGYCANKHWVVQMDESLYRQGDKFGTLHPNTAGHKNYATHITNALVTKLDF